MSAGVSELVVRREIPRQLLFERSAMKRIRGCALQVRASDRLRVLYANRAGGPVKELHLRTMRSRTLLAPDADADASWRVLSLFEVDEHRLLISEVSDLKGVRK